MVSSIYMNVHLQSGRRHVRMCEAVILGFPRQEVEEVDTEASWHQHLPVETVPVGAQMKRDLKAQ